MSKLLNFSRPKVPAGQRITRRQAAAFMSEMHMLLNQLLQGEVAAVRGEPCVVRFNGELMRMSTYLIGWVAVFQRMLCSEQMPVDLRPVIKMAPKLDNGIPLTIDEVDAARRVVHQLEEACVYVPADRLQEYVRTEQIAVELESLGLMPKAAA